mgnify:FL=1
MRPAWNDTLGMQVVRWRLLKCPVGQHGRHSLHSCIAMSLSPDEQIIAQSPNGLFARPERANKGPLPSRPKIERQTLQAYPDRH